MGDWSPEKDCCWRLTFRQPVRKQSSVVGGWIDEFYSYMQIDSRTPKTASKTGSTRGSWYGWGFKRELNEMQNVLVWVWFYGVSVYMFWSI